MRLTMQFPTRIQVSKALAAECDWHIAQKKFVQLTFVYMS
jgi:hypothetical protein